MPQPDPLVRPRPLAALVDEALADLLVDPPELGAAAQAAAMGVAQAHDRVVPGGIFVARRGARVDGHEFAEDAVDAGALAIVGDRLDAPPTLANVPYIRVRDTKAATGRLAAALYGHPSRQLTVIGVTGTDGKTTTSMMLHGILAAERGGAGLISTARILSGDVSIALEGRFTTPEAPEVQALLARFVADGLRFAVIESSSHGLAQGRLEAIDYDVAVVTTFSPEHLDFHGDLEGYLAAKQRLVRRAPVAVLNRDLGAFDAFAAVVGSAYRPPPGATPTSADALGTHAPVDAATSVVSYGRAADADYRIDAFRAGPAGVRAQILPPTGAAFEVRVPIPGAFNAANACAAIAAAAEVGVSLADGAARIAALDGVPGRMQPVQREPFAVIVDFAHTAEALGNALATLRAGAVGRLIVVVGAAGERDPGKRAPIGAAAVRGADRAIFTEEDARSESVDAILERMAVGAREAGGREGRDFELCPDRRRAIRRALEFARDGDVVLLAGKGHEATLERADEALRWDEAAEAAAALRALASEGNGPS